MVNPTDVDVMDGLIHLGLGRGCKFTKEPDGFIKEAGTDEEERTTYFAGTFLHARTVSLTYNLDFICPPLVTQIQLGISYRCHTCALDTDLSPEVRGIIHIIGRWPGPVAH